MGMHQLIEPEDGDELPQQFVARCATAWARHGQARDDLAKAMLTHAINMMIEDDGADLAAHVLAGLAVQIKPQDDIGHA